MAGLETLLAAAVGLLAGAGIVGFVSSRRERRGTRARVELEARVRSVIVPVLERRAAVLGIPPAARGRDEEGTMGLALTLARAIQTEEESGELPFGDTVEVARDELDAAVSMRSHRG